MKPTNIENVVHSNLGNILTTNSDRNKTFRHGLYLLKNTDNFPAKCKTVDQLSKISVAFNKYIYGNPIPENIATLGASKSNYFSKDLLLEIEWFTLAARKYRAEISFFLNYKKDFENYFLLGMYKEALESIEKCEKIVGRTIWGITSRFLVYEYTASQAKAKILQTEVLEKNSEGTFTTSLINYMSQRCERKLSAYRYDSDLKNSLNHVKSNLNQPNKDYYNFQLNFFETLEYKEIKDVVCFDYCNPIVDRYLTFRKTVIYCVANGILSAEIFERLRYLQKRIKDNFWGTLNLFFDENFDDDAYFDSEYLKIVDLYYSGLYEEVCSKIKKSIKESDIDFNLINLYARSMVLNKKSFSKLIETPSVINEIAENIYKIHSRNSNPSEALYSLYQISKNIDSFDINYSLNTYIKTEQKLKTNVNYMYLTLKKADPLVVELFPDKIEIIEKILDKISSKTFKSISVSYRKQILKGEIDISIGVSDSRINIDRAKLLFKKGQYKEALFEWEKIYKDNIDNPPLLEASIEYIFKILCFTEQYDSAIKFYVDSVLRNHYLVFKVDAVEIHKTLKKKRFKNVENNIYLPIFISLVSTDENEKAFAIEMYCKTKGAIFPSEYFSIEGFVLDPLTEMFLHFCCNNETLKNYKKLNTTKKRLDERINICNFLAKHETPNSQSYSDELNLLTNELIIHEGTQKLDESKIYANDQAILNKELDEFEGLYNRYSTIAGLVLKNIKFISINKNELRYLDKKSDTEYEHNEIEYSEHADIDAFNNIFSVVREKFLFSKFGIVTYLSTRIRHGVLLGELRPELEKNNLIFFKSKAMDKYEPTSFWLNNSRLKEDEKMKLIQLISDFSLKIDNLINKIIKQNIQIKLNGENELGWFDYEFSIDELTGHSVTLYYSENYKEFCKKVLEILWDRTNDNLERIRAILQDEVKTEFVAIINEFDGNLHKLLGEEKMPEIFTAVNLASTNIQNKIDKISTWFNRSGKVHKDFKLDLLVGIICKNVQRAHPLKKLEVTNTYKLNYLIKGEYYEHFNDFIRIFIENILKHTIGNTIKCSISIEQIGNQIVMVFENGNINPESELPYYDLGEGKELDRLKLVTEGKSGFVKALKTIKDDLKDEKNSLILGYIDNKFRVTTKINIENLKV